MGKVNNFKPTIIYKLPGVLSLSDVGFDRVDPEVHDLDQNLGRGQRRDDERVLQLQDVGSAEPFNLK